MPDRLAELRRQRALVQEHLAWLDREIAAAAREAGRADSPSPPEFQSPTPPPTPASPSSPPSPATPLLASDLPAIPGESLLDQYRVEPAALHADVRKGCFLYFAAAFALLVVVVGILYVALSTR